MCDQRAGFVALRVRAERSFPTHHRDSATCHPMPSGTPRYNMGLSLRRAHAVAGDLVRDGAPTSAIAIRGCGQTRLLVPTGFGVREPQNRRVETILDRPVGKLRQYPA
jgi:hypothetical protein